jgi:hypothetical protein
MPRAVAMPSETAWALREHLWSHLTDGYWHGGCRWCVERRVHGGTGVSDAERAAYDVAIGPESASHRQACSVDEEG